MEKNETMRIYYEETKEMACLYEPSERCTVGWFYKSKPNDLNKVCLKCDLGPNSRTCQSSKIYHCVFDEAVECSVQKRWKLVPESLVMFCNNCQSTTKPNEIPLKDLSQIVGQFLTVSMANENEIKNSLIKQIEQDRQLIRDIIVTKSEEKMQPLISTETVEQFSNADTKHREEKATDKREWLISSKLTCSETTAKHITRKLKELADYLTATDTGVGYSDKAEYLRALSKELQKA